MGALRPQVSKRMRLSTYPRQFGIRKAGPPGNGEVFAIFLKHDRLLVARNTAFNVCCLCNKLFTRKLVKSQCKYHESYESYELGHIGVQR